MTWNADVPKAANQILADVEDVNENLKCLAYINMWIPAAAMIPLDTNGATFGTYEYATNDVMLAYYAFPDGAVNINVAANVVMPENWNRGTVKAKFMWSSATGSTAGDKVEWQIKGLAVGDNDAIDAAYTDAGEVISDTLLANNGGDIQVSAATPAVTINGTPALTDLVNFKISRSVAGDDDMAEDAWLFGVYLQLGINEAITAW